MLCHALIKQFAVIFILHISFHILMAEVLTDIEAFQSSTHNDGFASYAVDKKYCETASRTKIEAVNWIVFDLKNARRITLMRIQFSNSYEMPINFSLSVANSSDEYFEVKTIANSLMDKYLYLLELQNTVARFIKLSSRSALSVCHVEVMVNIYNLRNSIAYASKSLLSNSEDDEGKLINLFQSKCNALKSEEKLVLSFRHTVTVEYVILESSRGSDYGSDLSFGISRDLSLIERTMKSASPTLRHNKIRIYNLEEFQFIGSYLMIMKSDVTLKELKLCRIHIFGKRFYQSITKTVLEYFSEEIIISKRSGGGQSMVIGVVVVVVLVILAAAGAGAAFYLKKKKKVEEKKAEDEEISFYRDLSKFNETIKKSIVNMKANFSSDGSDGETGGENHIQIDVPPQQASVSAEN